MKRFFMASLLAALYAGQGFGALFLSDNFPVDGAPPAGWTLVSGTGGQSVIGGQLQLNTAGTGAGTGDYSKPLSSAVSTGTLYAGYDLVIQSAPTDALDNYFSHFAINNAGGGGFFSRVSLNLVGTDTVLGLAESTTTGSIANVFGSTPLAIGTTYRLVQSYDFASGEARVWLNPTDASSPSLVDSSFTPNATGLASFNFRINNISDGNKLIDNFVVADTFNEVVSAVPEPNAMFLTVLVGLALGRKRIRSCE